MTRAVSIILPSLGTLDLLEKSLPPLLGEVAMRALGDEVIVVDDTGRGMLQDLLGPRFPGVEVVVRKENGGFAKAMASGVEAARHELVFSMNTDVIIRPGFLDPLVACMEAEDVAAVVPQVLLDGDPERIESVTEVRFERGMPELVQVGLQPRDEEVSLPRSPVPVLFAVGGTCLFRRSDFVATGFDSLYEPFYWEDVDYCFEAWRAGRRILYQPASIVEHHHRGTIGSLVPEEIFRAAIEKNRLLFCWKHLDDPELMRAHLAALYRQALDAWIRDERDELIWLDLALEQVEEALAARAGRPPSQLGFEDVRRASRPME